MCSKDQRLITKINESVMTFTSLLTCIIFFVYQFVSVFLEAKHCDSCVFYLQVIFDSQETFKCLAFFVFGEKLSKSLLNLIAWSIQVHHNKITSGLGW